MQHYIVLKFYIIKFRLNCGHFLALSNLKIILFNFQKTKLAPASNKRAGKKLNMGPERLFMVPLKLPYQLHYYYCYIIIIIIIIISIIIIVTTTTFIHIMNLSHI